ncbi:MAG: hypothetical protein A3H69_06035 [Candidatus Sungbacteria bacterium RIFCSPLOWO2_02_FULL_47_9]|uniref:Uncharacterized protein n=1 Tax=Candidatus Sungbacteria bacterium RIFCSPHIGHO2_01_FULL_47_32 TaxID=1802264 RepID=A0A1G2K3V9_9BACT|nr:MAG: hypothetical protein A2633_03820 [Candidatus Sungbacteria bacterium RIFCSPHIGHO2_01_FULL_47_32]OGZ98502.1 MAG: hypothetical protein A3D57_00015 [Candidatus Sungbacteria bacterium RIFCSPHIGHO2_02_FULL_46_12]OHA05298.1 MAG: hypothetical protein A3A28_01785 [Candidatus Sungbacteria bacterium RIFCSPLOWO2_01_FULL_47_32]OHA10793.1 MAG: hypothetical protein A3H69_06035 [Candidatus Sungbacteria bacterium RIFCSPLOWO2_02_FULL_47_9]
MKVGAPLALSRVGISRSSLPYGRTMVAVSHYLFSVPRSAEQGVRTFLPAVILLKNILEKKLIFRRNSEKLRIPR